MEVNMTKIMLVEDDKSLREIYGVRLLAEGYEIISAGDGEEALAMAVKEKPDLILSDVMMPKISGFDMLDILRSTPETKDIKVIMMTALSSEDQRTRGETLGANRYLVKSQVGIEDVVRTVHDVLADTPIVAAPKIQRFGVPAQSAATVNQPVSVPSRPMAQPTIPTTTSEPEPTVQPTPSLQPTSINTAPITPTYTTTQPVAPTVEQSVINTLTPAPSTTPTPNLQVSIPTPPPPQIPTPPTTLTPPPIEPVAVSPTLEPVTLPQPTAPFSSPAPASLGDRVINPITPVASTPDIADLMNNELHDGSETSPTNSSL
jgi:CheY-like chemotaxis protein